MGIFDLQTELNNIEQAIDGGQILRKVAVAAKREFLENILEANGIDRDSFATDEIVFSGVMGGQVILQAGRNTALTLPFEEIEQYMDYTKQYEQLSGQSFPNNDSGFHGALESAYNAQTAKNNLLVRVIEDSSDGAIEAFRKNYLEQRDEAILSFTGYDSNDLDSFGFVNIDPVTNEAVFVDLDRTNQPEGDAFIKIPAAVIMAYNQMNQEFMSVTHEAMDDSNFHFQLYEAYGAAEVALKTRQAELSQNDVGVAEFTAKLAITPKM